MAFRAGTTSAFYLSNTAGALQNLSGYADNLGFPQTVQTLDVSVFGTQAKSFITGLTDGDIVTMSGPYDAVVVGQLGSLKSAGSAASWIYGPGGSVASQFREAGSAWVAALAVNTTVGGRVDYSASLQVTGAVVNGTF